MNKEIIELILATKELSREQKVEIILEMVKSIPQVQEVTPFIPNIPYNPNIPYHPYGPVYCVDNTSTAGVSYSTVTKY